MRSSALWNPAGPLALDFLGLESRGEEPLALAGLELTSGEGEGAREGVERVGCGVVVVGRVGLAEGSALSTGWSVPRWGKGSSSKTTLPSAPVADTGISTVAGRGSKTVLGESLESMMYECLLWSREDVESSSPLFEGGEDVDCPS